MTRDIDELRTDGFLIVRDALDANTVLHVIDALEQVQPSAAARRRGNDYFGLRNLLNVVPAVRELAELPLIRSIVEPLIGDSARVVRGIFFDKIANANWKVPWHQDLTIAVCEKKETVGFTGWSNKAGIPHVQPPLPILEELLTLRIHLDDADASNGALYVIPGSHRFGRLDADETENLKQQSTAVCCAAARGDVVVMRPLILHSSSPATNPSHRRVVHLDFSPSELPGELRWHGS